MRGGARSNAGLGRMHLYTKVENTRKPSPPPRESIPIWRGLNWRGKLHRFESNEDFCIWALQNIYIFFFFGKRNSVRQSERENREKYSPVCGYLENLAISIFTIFFYFRFFRKASLIHEIFLGVQDFNFSQYGTDSELLLRRTFSKRWRLEAHTFVIL